VEEYWINKIDVARRHISEAVRLFFGERDAVVIHTIIASAHQVLFDIGSVNEIRSVLKNTEALKERGPSAASQGSPLARQCL
jgi:hypothetical protein